MPPVPRFPGLVCGLVRHVSDIPWPEGAKGINLGSIVNTFCRSKAHQCDYPDVARQLIEMGMLRSGETHRLLEWKEQTMPALHVYYDLHGDSIVPVEFAVPEGDAQWPVQTWNLRLGRVVDKLRQEHLKQKLPSWLAQVPVLEDLQEIDFSFDVYETTWSECLRKGHGLKSCGVTSVDRL